jgi:hypothetical protein
MATYDDGLIPDHHPPSNLEWVQPPPFSAYADKPEHQVAPVEEPRTICGIRRITFLLLAIIVVLVIVGAVGGGVAGSVAVKNAQNLAVNSVSTSPLAATSPSAATRTLVTASSNSSA